MFSLYLSFSTLIGISIIIPYSKAVNEALRSFIDTIKKNSNHQIQKA